VPHAGYDASSWLSATFTRHLTYAKCRCDGDDGYEQENGKEGCEVPGGRF